MILTECAVRASNWLDTSNGNDENNVVQHKPPEDVPPEDLVNRFGTRASLLILCIALFIAAVWIFSRPSFEKCSVSEIATVRNACYDELRSELMKPPAKGADAKISQER